MPASAVGRLGPPPPLRRLAGALFALLLVVFASGDAEAQNGQITGTVMDASGAPLATVQVALSGTQRGTLTNAQGNFTLPNVPPGTYTLVAQRVGYQEARQGDVRVGAGQTANVRVTLSPAVLALQAIVATGLIDPVEGVRSPISVARVDRTMMPIAAAGNALQNVQGRVAGVTMNRASGQPGSGTTIRLRTPTSLRGSGAPLVVVDGVILGGVLADANTTAIEGMDIESIEIIRGAAAASLYGSRAASGVIAITTARGRALEPGRTQFTARSEIGLTEAFRIDDLPTHHHYLVNAAGTSYVNAQGVEVPRTGRVPMSASDRLQFMVNPYPSSARLYDNLGAVIDPGIFQAHNFSVSQNTESTNFAASLSRTSEQGSAAENDGYYRNSVRLNIDHRFLGTMKVGMSLSHARDGRDEFVGGFFTDAIQAPRDVDIRARDANGNYLQQPDPLVAFQSPLWTQTTRDGTTRGNRTILSANYGWSPFAWLDGEVVGGYDRREQSDREYVPKGTPPNIGSTTELDGYIDFDDTWTDTWNASATTSLRREFGDLGTRVTFRGAMERDRTELGNRRGENFVLFGIPQISNTAPDNREASSSQREIKASNYLVDVGLDYAGRYTATILGRRDGSSLFGANARWKNYYRVAGAWRIAEESWFNIPSINELKVSYARGTAGGRPAWASQYETWTLSNGLPVKNQLGNADLRPEHTTEQEVSLNMIVLDKYSLAVVHAWQETVDQIVPAPQPAYTGYTTQIVNAGAVAGHTTEVTLEANLIQRPNLGWNALVIGDYSTSKITDWPLACDATQTFRFDCTGEPVYGIYGFRQLTSIEQLADHFGGSAVPFADQFQVNDEGYLVWVGPNKSYTDGMVNGVVQPGTWGTVSPNLGGRTYEWGLPFFETDETNANKRPSLGIGAPVNLGLINNLRLGNFNFHAQLHASVGGVANNTAFQAMINNVAAFNHPAMDQSDKPDGLKKPIAYYRVAVGSGGSTYSTENADYLKLRTLAVNYRFNQSHFDRIGLGQMNITSLTLGLTGRNIWTYTKYSGFDPEQALDLATRGNSAGFAYPPTRTWAAEFSLTF